MTDPAHHRPAATVAEAPPRAAASAALIVGLTLVLAGCAGEPTSTGDAHAHDVAEAIAADIGSHSANAPEITLLEMVAWWVPEDPVSLDSGSAVVEALDWSGESAGSQATIDIRVAVDVEGSSSTQLFGESWSSGSATRCFRLEWQQYEEARRSEIPCPDGPAPARPTPAPRPELTSADRDRISEIVAGGATADDVDRSLRVAYSQDYIRIETTAADGGVVAAVGIPAERECVLVFRDAAGAITYPDFRPISLEPGETGCSTALYTNPPF